MTPEEIQSLLGSLADNELDLTARMALRTLEQRRRLGRRKAKVIELFPARAVRPPREALEDTITICSPGPPDELSERPSSESSPIPRSAARTTACSRPPSSWCLRSPGRVVYA